MSLLLLVCIHVVAADWIFTFQMKFVDLKVILGSVPVVGGLWAVLEIFEVVFNKTCFSRKLRKTSKMLDNVKTTENVVHQDRNN